MSITMDKNKRGNANARHHPALAPIVVKIDPEFSAAISELKAALEQTSDHLALYNNSRGANGLLAAMQAEAANEDGVDQGHMDNSAVDALADAMKCKLAQKRAQGYGGWEASSAEHLSTLLIEHVSKGDPVDVANFCAFLYSNKQSIASLRSKKQLGQWVFDGEDEKWVSAVVDDDGHGYLCTLSLNLLEPRASCWDVMTRAVVGDWKKLDGEFDASNWRESAISREPVNDVGYLDERQDFESQVLDAADINNVDDALSLSNDDIERIFIKNLADSLIQRIHQLERFSSDDSPIKNADIKAWDIVIGKSAFNDQQLKFALVVATSSIHHNNSSSIWLADLTSRYSLHEYVHTGQAINITFNMNDSYRTISEDEIAAFRAAMEATYV